ncbi:hypothetical protein BYZ73_15755 [Rhodovulum viride]|uniref:Invasion protein IalB n=1 Tax=Rhodovulum viride TaxID=1231134 RepID=A0ABX9DDI3_9RHOB|nr:hypothetical protein [Rhodovulum viride]RAP40396.1 hypothetical protein BYZ73_15755 [Rhodovulum viride]
MRRFLILLAAGLLHAASVEAQMWMPLTGTGGEFDGAVVCEDHPWGESSCILFGCRAGQPIDLYVVSRTLTRSGLTDAMLTVDGRVISFAAFQRQEGHDDLFFAGETRQGIEAIAEPLRRGSRFALDFEGGAAGLTLQGSLRGSSQAIDHALSVCPMPLPAPVADPAGAALAQVQRDCADIGGTVTLEQPMARPVDIDGVAPMDLAVDFGAVRCSSASSMYCGSGGCSQQIYLGVAGGGYRPIYGDTMYGFEVPSPGVLRVEVHGSACGRVGASGACSLTFRVDPDGVTLLSRE